MQNTLYCIQGFGKSSLFVSEIFWLYCMPESVIFHRVIFSKIFQEDTLSKESSFNMRQPSATQDYGVRNYELMHSSYSPLLTFMFIRFLDSVHEFIEETPGVANCIIELEWELLYGFLCLPFSQTFPFE